MEDKKLNSIVEEIEKMNILEVSKLVKLLEDKFDVKANNQVQVVASGVSQGQADGSDNAGTQEKTAFEVILESTGEKKIEVIKALRVINPELGLKEAKDLTEATPKTIKESVDKDEADKIKKMFEDAGATITLK
jgi:large subunit ribosomal protein L7/L12